MENIILNKDFNINNLLNKSFFFKIKNSNIKGINDYFDILSNHIIENYKILIKNEMEKYNRTKDRKTINSKA